MKSKIIGRKHLLTLTLVAALGLAVFVNWYYTKQDDKITSPDVTENVNLGDAQYVNSDAVKTEDDYFAEAEVDRTKAHDSAKEYLEEIISDSSTDENTKASAREKLLKISEQIKTESDIENLISAQTSNECLVTLGEDSVEVILPKGTVTEDILIKIKDIIISKTSLTAESITIIELK